MHVYLEVHHIMLVNLLSVRHPNLHSVTFFIAFPVLFIVLHLPCLQIVSSQYQLCDGEPGIITLYGEITETNQMA